MTGRKVFIFILSIILCVDLVVFADQKYKIFGRKISDRVNHLADLVLKGAGETHENPDFADSALEVARTYPADLEVFKHCYPDVQFEPVFDENYQDWLIHITAPVVFGKQEVKKIDFYWADGRFLPESELSSKEKYWTLIYNYEKRRDPSSYTEDELDAIRNFSSTENRKDGKGTPMFFYDFLYSAKSQIIIEDHILYTTFLGKKTKVHERIIQPLKNVENRINQLAEINPVVKAFCSSLKSCDAYNWRIIEGTGRKSFHTYGIAVDILPKKLSGKAIFWSWTKDKDPKNWMLTPFENRWNPPDEVIDAFEKEGFIWGGNWIIFDNMHFEYHPELLYSRN